MAASSESDLVGSWELVSYHLQTPEGAVLQPLGAEPVGMGVYTREGTVTAVLMRRDRPMVGGSLGEAVLSPEVLRDVAGGAVAYAGTYSVDEVTRTVRHRVRCSLVPDWVGTELVRTFSWEGPILLLEPAPTARGRAQLRWRRVSQ